MDDCIVEQENCSIHFTTENGMFFSSHSGSFCHNCCCCMISACMYVCVGFLISGLNMLVMMLFFNIFLGSYMVFQVKYSLSFPGLSRCMFYTLYVAWLFPHVEPSCRVNTDVVGETHIHTHVVQVHTLHCPPIQSLHSKCHHAVCTDVTSKH